MPYENKPCKFTSDPGGKKATVAYSDGTSRYYIYRNGIIRVKFKDGHIHVRPGKNLCFLPDAHGPIDAVKGDAFFTYDGGAIAFKDAMDKAKPYQRAQVGKVPGDFYLKHHKYRRGRHKGHPITRVFSATVGGKAVDKHKLDVYIRARFGAREADLIGEHGDIDLRTIADHIT
jgi:hypothetical protein